MTVATDQAFHGGEHGAAGQGNDSVKGLMERVLDQLATADRRNGDLLRQMQSRLDAMGEQARAGRPGVPSEYRPGFERIEDGMTLLAHRIADSFAGRGQAAAITAVAPAFVATSSAIAPARAFIPAPVAESVALHHSELVPEAAFARFEAYVPTPAAASTPAFVPAPIPAPAVSAPIPAEVSSPQPLRSSTPGFVPARPGKLSPGVDTFDVIESMPGNPSEPWSFEQAEALASIYESPAVVYGTRAVTPPSEPAPDFVAGPLAAKTTAAPSPLDRTWLESRFAEIAGRIEQSQANTAGSANDALRALAGRFDALEHQLGEALQGLSSARDPGSLHHFEDQIASLSERLDQMRAELARFESIETKIGSILRKVSRERLTAIVNEVVQSQPQSMPSGLPGGEGRSDMEFHSVAIAAAEAAAARVAEQAPRGGKRDAAADARLDDVHALLAKLVSERRQGEEQTASVLDNLQTAMVRMLDRLEGSEAPAGGHHGPEPTVAEPHHRSGHVYQDDPAPWQPAAAADEVGYDAPAPEPDFGPAAQYNAQDDVVDPGEIADPIARQRASLKASAMRAATAQRAGMEATGVPAAPRAAPAGRSVRTSPAKPEAAGFMRYLKMGTYGVVLALATAGGIIMFGPRGAPRVTATLAPPPVTVPVGTVQGPGAADAPGLNAMPQSGAPGNPGLPGERLQDDGSGRPAASRSSYNQPGALRGIMIQGQTIDTEPVPGPGAARPAVALTPAAVKISATPADVETAAAMAADMDEQPRTALGLPPATVGPLSLRLAAGNGDPSAEFEVASRLMEGKGTDQNLALAVRWYQRAATKGFAQAQYRLGTLYERGLGVGKDLGRAKNWYTRAAGQGNVKAMHNLAVLAAGRSGLAPDYDNAAKWFKAAARHGLSDSQFNLAVLTESGLGAAKDPVAAAQWYMLAAQSGDREAVRRRDVIKAQLGKADLATAEAYVRDWKADVPDKLANDASYAGQAWKSRQPGAAAENG